MQLRKCFDAHGCDRGKRHGYEKVYEPIFKPLREESLRILEIGVFRGAGIWSWLDYFPNARITGVDTFQRVPAERVEVLKHERVTHFELDTTAKYAFIPLGSIVEAFDIVIDDGCHKAESQARTYQNFRRCVKRGGRYFIEDVWPEGPGYSDLLEMLPADAKHHNLRETGHSDSYIIEIRC